MYLSIICQYLHFPVSGFCQGPMLMHYYFSLYNFFNAHNAHSHVGVAEVPKALQEVEEVLGLPHRHRRLERPEGPVAGQLAALGPDGLPQRLPATCAVKVHMQLHLNE